MKFFFLLLIVFLGCISGSLVSSDRQDSYEIVSHERKCCFCRMNILSTQPDVIDPHSDNESFRGKHLFHKSCLRKSCGLIARCPRCLNEISEAVFGAFIDPSAEEFFYVIKNYDHYPLDLLIRQDQARILAQKNNQIPSFMRALDDGCNTTLHLASMARKSNHVAILLVAAKRALQKNLISKDQYWTFLTARNILNSSALHYAFLFSERDTCAMKMLSEIKKASIDGYEEQFVSFLKRQDVFGRTVFHYAARFAGATAIEAFVDLAREAMDPAEFESFLTTPDRDGKIALSPSKIKEAMAVKIMRRRGSAR